MNYWIFYILYPPSTHKIWNMCLGGQEHHYLFKASACSINLDSLWPLFTFCVVFLFTFKILFPRNSKGYKTHANLTLNRARNLPPNQFMRFVADRALTNLSELRQIHHDMLFKDLHFCDNSLPLFNFDYIRGSKTILFFAL